MKHVFVDFQAKFKLKCIKRSKRVLQCPKSKILFENHILYTGKSYMTLLPGTGSEKTGNTRPGHHVTRYEKMEFRFGFYAKFYPSSFFGGIYKDADCLDTITLKASDLLTSRGS
jgi:hypothetical protein